MDTKQILLHLVLLYTRTVSCILLYTKAVSCVTCFTLDLFRVFYSSLDLYLVFYSTLELYLVLHSRLDLYHELHVLYNQPDSNPVNRELLLHFLTDFSKFKTIYDLYQESQVLTSICG